jgi:hypothetical protein
MDDGSPVGIRDYAMTLLTGPALRQAERVLVQHRGRAEPVLWDDIKQSLRRRFGATADPMQLMARIKECTQGSSESVLSYTSRFESVIDGVLTHGVGERMLSKTVVVTQFISGLRTELKLACMDAMSNTVDPFQGVTEEEITRGISIITYIASQKETLLQQTALIRRHSTPWQSNISGKHNSSSAASVNAVGLSGIMFHAQKLKLPEELIKQRFDDKVCLKCGKANHQMRFCKASRPVNNSNANARVNSAQADNNGEDNDSHDDNDHDNDDGSKSESLTRAQQPQSQSKAKQGKA